jgi:hypothetical protein
MIRRPGPVGQQSTVDPATHLQRAVDDPRENHAGTVGSAELVNRVIRAVQELDPAGLQARFDRATTRLGLAASIDRVVLPTARQLGRITVAGRRDHVQELLATEVIRAWLNDQASLSPAPWRAETVLLTCGPRDRDTVFVEALALLIRLHGWPCRVLGARTPILTVTAAARAGDTAAVVICATRPGRRQAMCCLAAAADLGVPTFFAGGAFGTQRSRSGVRGRYLGPNVQGACDLLLDTLAPNEAVRRQPPAI